MQVQELRRINLPYNYNEDKEKLKKFFLFFTENERFKYLDAIREPIINIDLNDLSMYDETGLSTRFEANCYTYLSMVYSIIDEISYDTNMEVEHSSEDIFMHHRISRFKEKYPEKNVCEVLGFLLRNYSINVISKNSVVHSIREIKSNNIGALSNVRGIVTRVSQVKPYVQVATYICESCGTETYQQIKNDTFDLLEECGSEKCRIRKVKGTLCLVTRGSKFIKYQSVQIQEFTSDVPHGSVPRVLNLECYDSQTEICRPGDAIVATGIFLPKPYYGYKKIKAGLLNDTFLHVLSIRSECTNGLSATMELQNNTVDLASYSIDDLVKSFAPEIFGMEDIKKILLLMLVSAPTITRADGMKIRGDINVLLLGDPGIAKSQLLKTVIRLAKRGVYTTGRGSSGVGLTASVSRDPITNEVILEGGALVLSDKGVCCIDELDKMNEIDRVSIHEVMEQQSVSVSKAGINTSLNARASILGAANPVKGRYDPKKSVEYNVNLPCSLLSRFDVLCILKDDFDNDKDLAMATHITNLHVSNDSVQRSPVVEYSQLSNYISECKKIESKIDPNLRSKLTHAYVSARSDRQLTPRYLLSLIRLSLAHARLRKSAVVEEVDVNEALRLMELMKLKVSDNSTVSLKQSIYNFIVSSAENNRVNLEELFSLASFDRSKIEEVITDFAASGIWMRSNDELIIFN